MSGEERPPDLTATVTAGVAPPTTNAAGALPAPDTVVSTLLPAAPATSVGSDIVPRQPAGSARRGRIVRGGGARAALAAAVGLARPRRGGGSSAFGRRPRLPSLTFTSLPSWTRPGPAGPSLPSAGDPAPASGTDPAVDDYNDDDDTDSVQCMDPAPSAASPTGGIFFPAPGPRDPALLSPGGGAPPGVAAPGVPPIDSLHPAPARVHAAPRVTWAPSTAPSAPAPDPRVTARLGLLRASRTEAAIDFASVTGPSAAELLSVQPAAARVLFCAPRIQAMARVSTPTEEAERTKAEKARKANAASLWHTHSTDQLQLFVFTAWQVIFQETPDTALLGLQLGLAANWHIADPEDFANQGPFLLNRQEGARLFTSLETAALACSRAKPPGSLSSALVAQVKSNLIQFFRLRAQAVLPYCDPPLDTPHRRDVSLIARAIVAQASGVRRAVDYAQQAIAELCAGRSGDPQTENAAFLALARPFYEAYLRNGMSNVLAAGVVKQCLAFEPPPFLAAAHGDTAVAWAALLTARASTSPPAGADGAATKPPAAAGPPARDGRSSPARRRSPDRHRSPPRHRSLARPRRSPPPRAQEPEPLAIPSSRAIIGGCSPHAHSAYRCPVCSVPGHRAYECPKAFFRTFGRTMPGHRDDGTQDPSAWRNDELVPAARADLAEYLRWTKVPLNRRCPVSIGLIAAGP